MNNTNTLNKAISLVRKKMNVVPERYAEYQTGYIFLAYPIGTKESDKARIMTPYYAVDLKTGEIGHFSPAFDLDGFSKLKFRKV